MLVSRAIIYTNTFRETLLEQENASYRNELYEIAGKNITDCTF